MEREHQRQIRANIIIFAWQLEFASCYLHTGTHTHSLTRPYLTEQFEGGSHLLAVCRLSSVHTCTHAHAECTRLTKILPRVHNYNPASASPFIYRSLFFYLSLRSSSLPLDVIFNRLAAFFFQSFCLNIPLPIDLPLYPHFSGPSACQTIHL